MPEDLTRSTTRWLLHSTVGLVLGVACVVLMMIAVVAFAMATGAPAAVPGVFSAEVGEEAGALAISFTPRSRGMLLVALVVAALYVLGPIRREARRRRVAG